MAKKTSKAEIEALQHAVKNIGARRPTQKETEQEAKVEPDQDENAAEEKIAGSGHPELKEKIEELTDLLQEQLNQIPATTAIAIFALGFVFGRLFSGKR